MTLDVTTALGTLVGLKARMGVVTDAFDALLEDAIATASSLIADYCGRQFGYVAAQVDRVAGHGTSELVLSRAPVWSIASIVLDGSTIDADDYECVGDDRFTGVVINRSGWDWTAMLRGEGAARDPVVGHERAAFTVTYAGGFKLPGQSPVTGVDQLPAYVTSACYIAATYFFGQRATDPTVKSESLLSYSVTYDANSVGNSGLPRNVEAMLAGVRFIAQA